MENWQLIYNNFSPIAFNVFSFSVHWYSLAYITAIFSSFYVAKLYIKKYDFGYSEKDLDDLFIWETIGIIIFSRIVYILVYDTHTAYYLTHPWQMFNPFVNGSFTGISGMSYHGGVIGFGLGAYIYTRIYKKPFGKLLDLAALSIPLGYTFGRIGNFLNQELIGRATDVPWGIYVDNVLRHPSQLYEAFLEGLLVFVIMYFVRKYKTFDGSLMIIYYILYSIMRFIAEFYRAPDIQMGLYFNILTMGQILSLIGMVISILLYVYFQKKHNKEVSK